MAFVSSIEGIEGQIRVALLEAEDEGLVHVRIGFDDETDATYGVVVSLKMVAGQPDNHKEITFDVVEYIPAGDETNVCNDGQQTKRFLVGDHRKDALSCICSSVVELVKHHNPDVISMMTCMPDLPRKALTKYEDVCMALRAVGYRGGRADPYLGTEIWMLTKAEET